MSDLTLTGAIPGLLRRGSPVRLRARCYQSELLDGDAVVYAASGAGFEFMSTTFGGSNRMGRADPGDGTLDLTDPTGRFHALLWLRERGHDLRWAENEAEVLAWSVLSVARGGGSIVGILAVWAEGAPNSAANYVRENVPESGHAGLLVWHKNALWMLDKPCGQSPEDRAASDRAALAAGYALRSDDGTLTLPPLPEVFDAR